MDAGQLATRATADHLDYVRATPFPHVVWDDFFPTDLLDEVLSEFPGRDAIRWERRDHDHSAKRACAEISLMGPCTRHLRAELNGQVQDGSMPCAELRRSPAARGR